MWDILKTLNQIFSFQIPKHNLKNEIPKQPPPRNSTSTPKKISSHSSVCLPLCWRSLLQSTKDFIIVTAHSNPSTFSFCSCCAPVTSTSIFLPWTIFDKSVTILKWHFWQVLEKGIRWMVWMVWMESLFWIFFFLFDTFRKCFLLPNHNHN